MNLISNDTICPVSERLNQSWKARCTKAFVGLAVFVVFAVSGFAQTTLNFEEFPDGTNVGEIYGAQGIHFLNDLPPGGVGQYRASPRISSHSNAPSAGNVLENGQDNCELSSSANSALSFWFDKPMSSASFALGTVGPISGGCSCTSGTETAEITFLDCNGTVLQQFTRTISNAFGASVDFTDPTGLIQRVNVDYGTTFCPETIDDLAFTPSGAVCADTTPPDIVITSHNNDQMVNQAGQTITGEVTESGILRSILVDGLPSPFRLESDGKYRFSVPVKLQEGNNTVTVVAVNGPGLTTVAQLRLFLGTPISASITNFHLTQRGVMRNTNFDVDGPMVVGKTAVIRMGLNVRTLGGAQTYASGVRMKVWRKESSGTDTLVETYFGTTYSPSVSFFNSPNDLAAIHFWIPGYLQTFDFAGEYRFTFEALVGLSQIGPALRPGNGEYVTFTETKPIRLMILPIERGSWSSVFSNSDHVRLFYEQLDTVARVYPVRDGITGRRGQSAGLIYDEISPLRLPDGTAATTDLDCCEGIGTGPEWAFIDKHSSGILGRANDQTVMDGVGNVIGGRIVNDSIISSSFIPRLGVYRPAARVNWPNGLHSRVIDENRNGAIEVREVMLVAAEFFDTQTGVWTDDFDLYEHGETFRFFRDLNNSLSYNSGEPVAPAYQRGLNQRGVIELEGPIRDALTARNENIPGTAGDYQFGSLWFPNSIFASGEFKLGPGQGTQPGKHSWIIASDIVAMAHELGHNFDFSHLGEYTGVNPAHLSATENAWAVYINGQSKAPVDVFGIMDFSRDPDVEVFTRANYQSAFDEIRTTSSAAIPAIVSAELFHINGLIYEDGRVESISTSIARGLVPTPESGSLYSIVFGSGLTVLDTVRFELDGPPVPDQVEQVDALGSRSFEVVAAFPPTSLWVEVREGGQTLVRIDRTEAGPTVQIIAPNSGESFGPEDEMTISWEANDPDSADLKSSIFYSPNGGGPNAEWTLVAGAVRGSTFQWNTANASGSREGGVIRVVASDGFNSGEDESDRPFSVESKQPRVFILQPRTGETILEPEHLIVRGIGVDQEDEIDQFIWTVDGNAVSELSEDRLPPLPPGTHTLRLEATDADGQQASDEVTLFVLADSDRDGMSDEFEELHGLNPGSVQDASVDLDGDGLVNFDESVYGTDPSERDSDGDRFTDGSEIAEGSNPLDVKDTPAGIGGSLQLYINIGGDAATDRLGRLWRADADFLSTPTSRVASFRGAVEDSFLSDQNVPQGVLLSERWNAGDLNYEIPLVDGVYSVVLYFSENCIACVNPDFGGTGPADTARLFDIAVEGRTVDAYNQSDAAALPDGDGIGATLVATEVVFRDVEVTDGVLNVNLIDLGNGNPPENVAIKGMSIRAIAL